MADDEFTPKTRDDWVGIFKDGFKGAQSELQSEREEAEAKTAAEKAAELADKTKEGQNNGGSGKLSFADRLLGKRA